MDKAQRLKEIQDIAAQNGGTCLSSEYIHSHAHLSFKCNQGHTWDATPTNIKRGKWCKKCGRVRAGLKKRLGIQRMCEIASERDGKCLSKSYENSQKSLLWRCSKGHTWFAKPNNIIVQKTWCPHCAGQRVALEQLHSFAKKKGVNAFLLPIKIPR